MVLLGVPIMVNAALPPAHTVGDSATMVAVGAGLTATVCEAVLPQPLPSE